MDAQRPNFIDLRTQSSASSTISKPLRSPRLHVAGEAPPELSPLDAFAMHSRMLARQLEESAKTDKRISRLPPLTTESPLIVQGRSDYFRSLSVDSLSDHAESPLAHSAPFGMGNQPELEEHLERPRSMHPRMSRIPPTPDEPMPALPTHPALDQSRGRPLENVEENTGLGLFGARRERSPSPMGSVTSHDNERVAATASPRIDRSLPPFSQSPEKLEQLTKSHSFDPPSLAPPRQLFISRSPSSMSMPGDRTDEQQCSPGSMSFYAPRKLSSSSGMMSPAPGSHQQRSPSISSDLSAPLVRPSFNFSRPISRAGTPSFDLPNRQASSDSQASFILADDTAHTPISMNSDCFPDPATDDPRPGAPSYIYSKYSLPRGKMLQRTGPFPEGLAQGGSAWDQSMAPPNNMHTIGQAPPSPPTRPSSSSGHLPRSSLERSKLSTEVLRPGVQPSPNPSRPSTDGGRSSEESPRGRTLGSPLHDAAARAQTAASTTTSDSASTIKPARSLHSIATAAEIPAEDHVAAAIELHQKGSLNESTYHLRHAARQGHPTGMLLYALACRHGWGMRANQKEGVEWLRKAADCAGLELADDEGQAKEGKRVDFLENKTRKAQFALSIYELGVSHMNGWGIEQDKTLALRCFEIAASWGDVDALTEAGFCYAQGIGCKKDLKKSARFYRQAEAKGVSMVGNSWIHKSKYDEGPQGSPKSEKKAARSKSRTRGTLFGLKSSGSHS